MLVSLLVIILVVGLLIYLVQMLPIAEPFKTAALIIVIIIAIVWLLGIAGMIPRGLAAGFL